MVRLGLAGRWCRFPGTLVELLRDGYALVVLDEDRDGADPPTLLIAVLDDGVETGSVAALARRHGLSWLAWDPDEDAARAAAAYRDGALAVVPGPPSHGHVREAVRTTLALVHPDPDEPPVTAQHYRRAQVIPRADNTALEVLEGVLAVRALHPDGAEVLLELCGPGQVVVSHPTDRCYVEAVAHTDVVAVARRWLDVARDPAAANRLRSQLVYREAWAAMQARPHLEGALEGILALLAERFGADHPQGVLVDVHITHALLASATGATRPTVTRLLSRLVRVGRLVTTGKGPRARFVLSRDALLSPAPTH